MRGRGRGSPLIHGHIDHNQTPGPDNHRTLLVMYGSGRAAEPCPQSCSRRGGQVEGCTMAERGGFEPPVRLLTVQRFSKPPPSATRPSLLTIDHKPLTWLVVVSC